MPHGRPVACNERHSADDPRLGEPICRDCYDHTGSVLFNALAPELWRRFTIRLRRVLARNCGLTVKELGQVLKVSFAKVAEYQRSEHHITTGRLPFEDDTVLVTSHWAYVGQGLTTGEALLAAAITATRLPVTARPEGLAAA